MRIAILVAIAALVVLAAYAVFSGLSAVVVTNQTGAEASIVLFTGAQPIGSGTLAGGASDFYLFSPHEAGAIAVGCRKSTQSQVRTTRVGHVTPGLPQVHRITLAACNRISHYSG